MKTERKLLNLQEWANAFDAPDPNAVYGDYQNVHDMIVIAEVVEPPKDLAPEPRQISMFETPEFYDRL